MSPPDPPKALDREEAGGRTREIHFRDLVEGAPDAIVICDGAGRIVLVNAAAERLFGYARCELLGGGLELLMPQRFRDRHRGHLADFAGHPATRRMGDGEDLFGLRRDGTEFPIETNLSLLGDGDDRLFTSIVRDLTGRRELLEREALLIRELNHRVKNVLASVSAITAQTLRATPDPAAFAAAFTARLTALSRSHDLLTRSGWSGALVGDLVAEQLAPYARDGSPFALRGPPVRLGPNRAVTLGMALGELATNAAKYGAIAAGGGVAVDWRVDMGPSGRRLHLTWREWGGSNVTQPARRGFGTRLLQRSLAAGLRGKASLDFASEGLTATLDFPLLDSERCAES